MKTLPFIFLALAGCSAYPQPSLPVYPVAGAKVAAEFELIPQQNRLPSGKRS